MTVSLAPPSAYAWAAVLALSVPGAAASRAQSSSIEVTTVKPSDPANRDEMFTVRGRHMVTTNTPVSDLIRFAYGLSPKQVEGAPDWSSSERFDTDTLAASSGPISDDLMRELARELLAQRFRFCAHHERKVLAVYVLSIAKGGPKLMKTERAPADNTDFYGPPGELIVRNATMQAVATGLSRGLVDRPVQDQTGLTDRYDFHLKWNPNSLGPSPNDTNALPDFYKAVQEQVGLKLTPARRPVDVLIIDQLEQPSAN